MEKKEYEELKNLISNGFSGAAKDYQAGFSNITENYEVGFSNVAKDYQEFANFVAAHFSSLEDRVKWLEENVATKSDINKILEILDGQNRHFDEQNMLIGQVNRHEGWIKEIAIKSDIQLDY